MRALDLRCAKATPVDPARILALEALVADCKTGFEAWERLVARGVLPIHWLRDERRRFATRARVLAELKRAGHDVPEAEHVGARYGPIQMGTPSPADKALAVRLAARAEALDEAERLAFIAEHQLRRFANNPLDRNAPPASRVLWAYGAPSQRSTDTAFVARSIESRLQLVFHATAIPTMSDPSQAAALIERVRSLGWQFPQWSRSVHCAMHRERWQLLLDAFAPYAAPDGSIDVRVERAGLDGTRVLRIDPHERENPFAALAALEALGVTLSGSAMRWIELSVPGFSGV